MGIHIGSGTQNLGLLSTSQPDLADSKWASLSLILQSEEIGLDGPQGLCLPNL